jgi:hypothetical protein
MVVSLPFAREDALFGLAGQARFERFAPPLAANKPPVSRFTSTSLGNGAIGGEILVAREGKT